MNELEEKNDLLIYKNKEGNVVVDAIYKDETLWLSQKGMARVFGCIADNISLHLKNIFKEGELDINSTTEKTSIVQKEGTRNVKRNIEIYNLDAIYSSRISN